MLSHTATVPGVGSRAVTTSNDCFWPIVRFAPFSTVQSDDWPYVDHRLFSLILASIPPRVVQVDRRPK